MRKEAFIKHIDPRFALGICHRGLHDNKTVTENSLNAYKAAIKENMAFELDIHLTRDNQLVVVHDSELKRVTGKEGIVEDLTLDEIEKGYRLLDGEKIPTFKEVLSLQKDTYPMVVELKVYRKNYKPLAKKAKEALKNIQNKDKIILISFDPRALFPFKRSGYMRELLLSSTRQDVYFFRRFFEGIDIDQKMIPQKRVRRYSKKHMTNVWTIETWDEFSAVYPYVSEITFQYLEPRKVQEKMQKKAC